MHQVLLVDKENLEAREILDQPDLPEDKDLQELLVNQEIRDLLVLKEQRATSERPEVPEMVAKKELRVLLDKMEAEDNKALLVKREDAVAREVVEESVNAASEECVVLRDSLVVKVSQE